jgi:hypothetical protein
LLSVANQPCPHCGRLVIGGGAVRPVAELETFDDHRPGRTRTTPDESPWITILGTFLMIVSAAIGSAYVRYLLH